MAQLNTVICDRPGCGKQKGENNHWWSIDANIGNKSMFIYPYGDTRKFSERDRYIHLVACGLECLGILESKIKEGVNPLK